METWGFFGILGSLSLIYVYGHIQGSHLGSSPQPSSTPLA